MLVRNKLATALFGLVMIGAKDSGCDPWAADDGNGAPSPVAAVLNFCPTDPPLGCVAICFVVSMDAGMPMPPSDTPTIAGNCSSGGPLAAQFVSDVQNTFDCDPDLYGASYVVFPTYFNLTPTVTKTSNCNQPPTFPSTELLSDFMGLGG